MVCISSSQNENNMLFSKFCLTVLMFMDLGPMQLAVIRLRILQIELHRQTPLRPPCHWLELRSIITLPSS